VGGKRREKKQKGIKKKKTNFIEDLRLRSKRACTGVA
jgi:hypothetical protein